VKLEMELEIGFGFGIGVWEVQMKADTDKVVFLLAAGNAVS